MGYLEQKRNAIINSVSGGGLTNLLDGISYEKGVLNGDGSIVNQTAYKEVITDYIPIDSSKCYVFLNSVPQSSNSQWVVAGVYDSNKEWVSRRVFISTGNASKFSVSGDNMNGAYIRLCFRTRGTCNASLYDFDEFNNLQEFIGD